MTYRKKADRGLYARGRHRRRVGPREIRVRGVHQRRRGLSLTPRKQLIGKDGSVKADLKEQLREVINNLLDVEEQPYSTVVDMCVKILLEFRSKSDPQHRLHDVEGHSPELGSALCRRM